MLLTGTLPTRNRSTTQQEAANERRRFVRRRSHPAAAAPTRSPGRSVAGTNSTHSQCLHQKHQIEPQKIPKFIRTSSQSPEFCSAAEQIKRHKNKRSPFPEQKNRTLEMRSDPRRREQEDRDGERNAFRFRGPEWREIPAGRNGGTPAAAAAEEGGGRGGGGGGGGDRRPSPGGGPPNRTPGPRVGESAAAASPIELPGCCRRCCCCWAAFLFLSRGMLRVDTKPGSLNCTFPRANKIRQNKNKGEREESGQRNYYILINPPRWKYCSLCIEDRSASSTFFNHKKKLT